MSNPESLLWAPRRRKVARVIDDEPRLPALATELESSEGVSPQQQSYVGGVPARNKQSEYSQSEPILDTESLAQQQQEWESRLPVEQRETSRTSSVTLLEPGHFEEWREPRSDDESQTEVSQITPLYSDEESEAEVTLQLEETEENTSLIELEHTFYQSFAEPENEKELELEPGSSQLEQTKEGMTITQQRMPFANEDFAPQFDEEEPDLDRYFEDLEELFEQAKVEEDKKKKHYGQRYVKARTARVWKAVDAYENGTYEEWKREIYRLYPGSGAGAEDLYSRAGLANLVKTWRERTFKSIGDWAKFMAEFQMQSRWLMAKKRLSEYERNQMTYDVLDAGIKGRVELRLIAKNPDTRADEYTLEMIDAAVRTELHGTSTKETKPNPAGVAGVSIKSEDVVEMFAKALERVANVQASNARTAGAPPVSTTARPVSMGCHYCNEVGHSIAVCKAVEEDVRAGKIKRNVQGRVVLPSGAVVPKTLPGNCIRDRVSEYHKQNPGNTAAGSLSYTPAAPASTMLLGIINKSPSIPDKEEAAAHSLTAAEMSQIQELERQIFAIKSRAAGGGPVRRSPRHQAGVSTSREVPSSARIEEVPDEDAPKSETATTTSSQPPIQLPISATRSVTETARDEEPKTRSGAAAESVSEHPFAKAKDATYLPPDTRNVGALPPKDAKGPAYRTVAPIESQAVAEKVVEHFLKAPAPPMTNGEMLALVPEARTQIRNLLTPKRVAQDKAAALVQAEGQNPVLPPPSELLELPEGTPGVIRIKDPVEVYISNLAPGQQPKPITVAAESHALRALMAFVGRRAEVECIIDPGSQIISMSEETCHALGLEYDPTIILNMQSANGGVDPSLGLARNVPFVIGSLTLYLQVHVIRNAAYDILLGRPFDVLTESVVRNYKNATQTITLHCPNTDQVTTVPTFERGSPRFARRLWQNPSEGF